ncbi:hypothetical protein [Pseudomonas phage D6]|nr:hypothetical protein [Pseudomonas phage D6]
MTYIVADRNFVIADRLVGTTTGSNITGRKGAADDHTFKFGVVGDGKSVYFNDCTKLYAVGGNATYKGVPIKLFALAGAAANDGEILGSLHQGVDLNDYMIVEANILPKEDRRIFNGKTDVFIYTEDNVRHVLTAGPGNSISTGEYKNFAHIGSGQPTVNGLRFMLQHEPGKNRLTALEAYVLACTHTSNVSRNFDTYEMATGKFIYDRRLSDRQMKHILAKIQSRIDITDYKPERSYLNEE